MGCFRSSNVTLQHLSIEGCEAHSLQGFIDIDGVENVILDGIEFVGNKDNAGPSSISAANSSFALHNISASRNIGGTGGFLSVVDCRVAINGSNFHGNIGQKGGALFMSNSDIDIRDAWFEENHSDGIGGAVYLQVRCFPDV